jgi:hypothetical protein
VKPRLDLPVVAAGSLCSGALAVGLALLFRRWIANGQAGPTAATLDEAFALLLGAAVGLATGSAAVGYLARKGSPVLAGAVAAGLGYVIVVLPILVLTGPSDVSAGDSLAVGVLAAVFLFPPTMLGAVLAGRARSIDTPGR